MKHDMIKAITELNYITKYLLAMQDKLNICYHIAVELEVSNIFKHLLQSCLPVANE